MGNRRHRANSGHPLPTGLRIRRATTADAAAVAATHVASWRVGYAGVLPDAFLSSLSVQARTRSWAAWLDEDSGGRTFVAVSDEDTVHGFTSVGPCRDNDSAAGTGELWALYVRPDAWGQGLGSTLLAAATSDLASRGFSRATLWVLTGNERARRFYEHHQWHLEGRSRVERRGDLRLDEVRYALTNLSAPSPL